MSASTTCPITGPSLADSLSPLDGTAVPTDVIEAVLRSIPVLATVTDATTAAGELVLGRDGTFGVGAAAGRGVRRPASVVGAAAQERRRLARLAELDAAIATAGHRLAAVEREAEALQRRDAAVRADLAALPVAPRSPRHSGRSVKRRRGGPRPTTA